ncbi:hypothetical protein MJO28_004352 [Puccinia striiformis f. sp. tritici]|uniref:Uncharacterized protein n=2 Tax=Puccinia striiformis TaxID=27350 RepID=A0A2S4V7B1_9BASI|nr:hypothetical protein Pst134EB_008199 [Puccinia striiformis f. sp. tritici]KAI7957257.1 hypothetical protein MJO28_004352 [Puccinia striiformis f. sp. tritici]POW05377.1 hypothetical protein PSTT_09741 [Puccinia striiformis]
MTESRPISIASMLESIRSYDPLSSENSFDRFASPIDPEDPFVRESYTIDELHAFHTLIVDLFRSFALKESSADVDSPALINRMKLYNDYFDLHTLMISHSIIDEWRDRMKARHQAEEGTSEERNTNTEEEGEINEDVGVTRDKEEGVGGSEEQEEIDDDVRMNHDEEEGVASSEESISFVEAC